MKIRLTTAGRSTVQPALEEGSKPIITRVFTPQIKLALSANGDDSLYGIAGNHSTKVPLMIYFDEISDLDDSDYEDLLHQHAQEHLLGEYDDHWEQYFDADITYSIIEDYYQDYSEQYWDDEWEQHLWQQDKDYIEQLTYLPNDPGPDSIDTRRFMFTKKQSEEHLNQLDRFGDSVTLIMNEVRRQRVDIQNTYTVIERASDVLNTLQRLKGTLLELSYTEEIEDDIPF